MYNTFYFLFRVKNLGEDVATNNMALSENNKTNMNMDYLNILFD
jgi:hypothetical protein